MTDYWSVRKSTSYILRLRLKVKKNKLTFDGLLNVSRVSGSDLWTCRRRHGIGVGLQIRGFKTHRRKWDRGRRKRKEPKVSGKCFCTRDRGSTGYPKVRDGWVRKVTKESEMDFVPVNPKRRRVSGRHYGWTGTLSSEVWDRYLNQYPEDDTALSYPSVVPETIKVRT